MFPRELNVIGHDRSLDICEEFDFSLRTLVHDIGWEEVGYIMYVEGQEDGWPLDFWTEEEYEPYLDYRVVKLSPLIIRERKADKQ